MYCAWFKYQQMRNLLTGMLGHFIDVDNYLMATR